MTKLHICLDLLAAFSSSRLLEHSFSFRTAAAGWNKICERNVCIEKCSSGILHTFSRFCFFIASSALRYTMRNLDLVHCHLCPMFYSTAAEHLSRSVVVWVRSRSLDLVCISQIFGFLKRSLQALTTAHFHTKSFTTKLLGIVHFWTKFFMLVRYHASNASIL